MKRWFLGWALMCLVQTLLAQDTMQGDSLQEVVVTGTGTQHLLKDAPVQTEVINSRMLRQFAGSSLSDILSGLTSSFAFNEGDMGSQMQMNGLGNNYILILIDGKRIHGNVGGENDLSLIDPHNIEKIEIVKGASSALYGSDAIAGVVNIITKKHNEGLMAENTTRYGSYNDLRQHNGVALAWGKWKSYTNFQLQHSDGWQNTGTEYTPSSTIPITDSRNKTVNEHTSWQVSEQLTFTPSKQCEFYANGSIYGKGIHRPKGKYPKYDVKTFDLTYRNASAAVGGQWKTHAGDVITLDIDWNKHAYYHSFTSTTLAEGFDADGKLILDFPYFAGQKLLQSNQERTMAHLKGVFSLPLEQRLSAGIEARYDYLKAPTSLADGTASDNTEALYVQDEWGMLRWLHLTGGLRLNRNEGFGWRLTPKVSAMVSMGDVRLRATWSQGFKSPSLKEMNYRYIREMNSVIMYLGNKDLKAQTSNYFSMSGEWNHKGMNVTVSGYYNKVENMIALVTIPRTEAPEIYRQQYGEMLSKVRRYQNMEDARTCGVDVSLRYSHKEWTGGISYSYLDTDAHVYDTNHDRLTRVVIDGMAHHKGSLFATWEHRFVPTYQLGIGIYGRMSSKRYYQVDGDGKGYNLWRISTTHTLGNSRHLNYRVEAGIDNIFNYVDRTPHGLHLGTNTPGTTFYATLSVRFSQGKKLINKIKSNLSNRNNDEDN
ncbi:MAG: TonB-dependent receptor [Bacteroidaceae bacterium]|nr:TonB-dependent receptor [Bacteroidaceae bacterium]